MCHLKKMPHIQTRSDERYKNYTINFNPSRHTDVGERFSAFSHNVRDILSHGIYYEAPSKPYTHGIWDNSRIRREDCSIKSKDNMPEVCKNWQNCTVNTNLV